jgi:hypothetical protein
MCFSCLGSKAPPERAVSDDSGVIEDRVWSPKMMRLKPIQFTLSIIKAAQSKQVEPWVSFYSATLWC